MALHLGPSTEPICPGIFTEMSAQPPPLTEGSSLQLEVTEEVDIGGKQGVRVVVITFSLANSVF